MSGRVGVVYGRVAVGKKSFTAVGRAWSGNLGDRDDRVDLIGSGNLPLYKLKRKVRREWSLCKACDFANFCAFLCIFLC